MEAELYKNGKLIATSEVYTISDGITESVRVEWPRGISFRNNDIMYIKYSLSPDGKLPQIVEDTRPLEDCCVRCGHNRNDKSIGACAGSWGGAGYFRHLYPKKK